MILLYLIITIVSIDFNQTSNIYPPKKEPHTALYMTLCISYDEN